jgi:hypothetical protein
MLLPVRAGLPGQGQPDSTSSSMKAWKLPLAIAALRIADTQLGWPGGRGITLARSHISFPAGSLVAALESQ